MTLLRVDTNLVRKAEARALKEGTTVQRVVEKALREYTNPAPAIGTEKVKKW